MKHVFKEPRFNAEYLSTVRWVTFRNQYMKSSIIDVADDVELYLIFKRHSERTIPSMERKLADRERKLNED